MKIVVLAGGLSTERDVSLLSGTMIYRALKAKHPETILLDVYLGYEDDITGIFTKNIDWAANINGIKEEKPDLDQIKAMRKSHPERFFGPNVIEICTQADIVFMALHGANGEDGKVQAAFDLYNIKYTGTDFTSSAIAMDKAIAKDLFIVHDIPTPRGIHIKQGQDYHWDHYPCVVKVNNGGSSVGVSIVQRKEDMAQALANAFAYGSEVIIEQYIKGREFSVGVIDGKALPVIEIAPLEGFYDYKNKYQAGSAIETCPADLPENITREMQNIAERVVEALRLKTYARMDFILSENNEIYCLEANTLPGMTPTSLLPQEAKAIGMDFPELCEKILEISFAKYL